MAVVVLAAVVVLVAVVVLAAKVQVIDFRPQEVVCNQRSRRIALLFPNKETLHNQGESKQTRVDGGKMLCPIFSRIEIVDNSQPMLTLTLALINPYPNPGSDPIQTR